MKKLFILASCATALSLTSCKNENNGAADTTDSAKTTTEAAASTTTTEAAPEAKNDVDKALDTYEANITKYADIMKKAQSGDASATKDAQALGTEMAGAAQTLATQASKMTTEQQKRLADLGKKYAEAMQAATAK